MPRHVIIVRPLACPLFSRQAAALIFFVKMLRMTYVQAVDIVQ